MSQATQNRLVVLIVEDEPLLRIVAIDFVEDAGFEAVGATDATHALQILERRPDIRIVFSDIDMPRGLDGVRLAALIRRRWPPIHLILTSGKLRPHADELPKGTVFFSKPYVEEKVVAAIRELAA